MLSVLVKMMLAEKVNNLQQKEKQLLSKQICYRHHVRLTELGEIKLQFSLIIGDAMYWPNK